MVSKSDEDDEDRKSHLYTAWGTLFCCLFALAGISGFSVGYHNSYYSGPITSWTDPKSASLGTSLCSGAWTRVHVCYYVYMNAKYQVGDQTYHLGYITGYISEKSEAEKFLTHYQSASRGIDIYYDRNNPAHNSLKSLPGKAFLFLMGVIFSSIIGLFALIGLCSVWCGEEGSAVWDCLTGGSGKNQEKGNSSTSDRKMDSLSSGDVGEIHLV